MRTWLHRLPFALAITLVLVLKVVILVLLYQAFFSNPQVKKMRMPTEKVEQHLLGQSAPPAVSTLPKAEP